MKRSRLSIKKESQILIMPLPTTIEAMLSIHGAFSAPLAQQAIKQPDLMSCYRGRAVQLLFDWPPLHGQVASAMHEGAVVCWHAGVSLTNSINGVSFTKRFNLSANPHSLAMTSKGPLAS